MPMLFWFPTIIMTAIYSMYWPQTSFARVRSVSEE